MCTFLSAILGISSKYAGSLSVAHEPLLFVMRPSQPTPGVLPAIALDDVDGGNNLREPALKGGSRV